MSKLAHIWSQSFLGRLLKEDPLFGRVVGVVLIIYFFIHIFRLEVYPLYMFAMYSQPEEQRETYSVYKVYADEELIPLDQLDYRKYTFINNTIVQYHGSITNDMYHQETKVIDKFINRLRLDESTASSLKSPYFIDKNKVGDELKVWLRHQLSDANISTQKLRIEEEQYEWNHEVPKRIVKSTIYEVD